MERQDTYQLVTDRIVAALEKGVIPWRVPWLNAIKNMRGTGYHGVNVLVLAAAGMHHGFKGSTWATFNQIRAAGGMVKKGEHGTPVVFWKFLKIKDQEATTNTETDKVIPMLRHFTVFNLDQQEGVKLPAEETVAHDPIKEAEGIVQGWDDKPPIAYAAGRAFYSPGEDRISLPPLEHFPHAEEYYSVLFHECIHSTGHEKRLARKAKDWTGFGSESYSKEELVAELGAAFLCANTGIVNATIDNSSAYIQSWLGRLRGDKRLIVTAAGAAQRAAEYITGNTAAVEIAA